MGDLDAGGEKRKKREGSIREGRHIKEVDFKNGRTVNVFNMEK